MFKAFIAPVRTPLVCSKILLSEQAEEKIIPLNAHEEIKHEDLKSASFEFSAETQVAFAP